MAHTFVCVGMIYRHKQFHMPKYKHEDKHWFHAVPVVSHSLL